jgi:hypothetical protein
MLDSNRAISWSKRRSRSRRSSRPISPGALAGRAHSCRFGGRKRPRLNRPRSPSGRSIRPMPTRANEARGCQSVQGYNAQVVASRVLVPTQDRRGSAPRKLSSRQGAEAERIEAVSTPEGHALYRRRQQIVEPVFAHTKVIRRSDRFLRRGLAPCRRVWQLVAATHNLLKLWCAGVANSDRRKPAAWCQRRHCARVCGRTAGGKCRYFRVSPGGRRHRVTGDGNADVEGAPPDLGRFPPAL